MANRSWDLSNPNTAVWVPNWVRKFGIPEASLRNWMENKLIEGTHALEWERSVQQLQGKEQAIREYSRTQFNTELSQEQADSYMAQDVPISTLAEQMRKDILKGPAGATPDQYTIAVSDQIKNLLGREASPEELQHFGNLLKAKEIDPYEFNQFLQQQPEYQQKIAEEQQTKLLSQAQEIDQPYLEKVRKMLGAKYAEQGRPGAGGFESSMIQAGKELAQERANWLQTLSYQDWLRGQQGVRSDYESLKSNLLANKQYERQLAAETSQRQLEEQNYARQKSDWDQYMNQQMEFARQQSQPGFLDFLGPATEIAKPFLWSKFGPKY